jgi:hypothetical protein
MTEPFPVDYGPLDIICLKCNYTAAASLPGLMVLCRSPADDGWIAIEDETAFIYTIFDSIAYLYQRYQKGTLQNQTSLLGTRAKQAALLARADSGTTIPRPRRSPGSELG